VRLADRRETSLRRGRRRRRDARRNEERVLFLVLFFFRVDRRERDPTQSVHRGRERLFVNAFFVSEFVRDPRMNIRPRSVLRERVRDDPLEAATPPQRLGRRGEPRDVQDVDPIRARGQQQAVDGVVHVSVRALQVDRGGGALGLVVALARRERAPRQMAAHDEILPAPAPASEPPREPRVPADVRGGDARVHEVHVGLHRGG
jgi:hypothetical protein